MKTRRSSYDVDASEGGSPKKRRVDGDGGTHMITIKSSDGKIHTIEAYHLQSSSTVFRAMIETAGCQRNRIVLTDPDIETSQVLKTALQFIAEPINVDWYCRSHSSGVVRFLDKYDCRNEIHLLGLELRQAIRQDVQPKSCGLLMILAANMSDWALCGDIIQRYGHRTFKPPPEDEAEVFGGPANNGRSLDPRTWDISRLHSMPDEAMWAFLRASQKVDWTVDKPAQYKAMAEEFVRLMKLPRQKP